MTQATIDLDSTEFRAAATPAEYGGVRPAATVTTVTEHGPRAAGPGSGPRRRQTRSHESPAGCQCRGPAPAPAPGRASAWARPRGRVWERPNLISGRHDGPAAAAAGPAAASVPVSASHSGPVQSRRARAEPLSRVSDSLSATRMARTDSEAGSESLGETVTVTRP